MGVTSNWDRRLSRRTFIGLGGMSAAALLLNTGRASAQVGYGELAEADSKFGMSPLEAAATIGSA